MDEDRTTDPPGPLAGLHILFMDDDVYVRDMVTMVLEHAGARISRYGTGSQVLEALGSAVPDVIVMDLKMPGASGLVVMRAIRKLDDLAARAVPAVALSGSIEEFGLDQVADAGFTECLSKPVSIELLVRTVGRLAGRAM